MKQIKLFSMMLLLATMFVGFNACSDDDDDKGNDSIVGKWKLMDDKLSTSVEFKSDGTFMFTNNEHGKYKVESQKLYLMFSDETDWIVYQIIELNSVSLVVKEIYDNGELGTTRTFQRVS